MTKQWTGVAVTVCAVLVGAGCASNTRPEERSIGLVKLQPASSAAGRDEPEHQMAGDGATDSAAATRTPADPGAASAPAAGPFPGTVPVPGAAAAPAPASTGTSARSTAAAPKAGGAAAAADIAPGERPAPVAPGPGGGAPATPAPAGPAPGGKSPIVLGSFGIESGPVAAVVGAAAPAIRAWAADINARGGLAGHPVRIVMADDGGDPARTQGIVRRMVEQDGIIAVFYPYGFDTHLAVMPYLESKGVPIIGTTSGNQQESNISTLLFNPLTEGGAGGLRWMPVLAAALQSTKKRAGILYCREVQGCAQLKDLVKSALPYEGIELVWEGQVSLAQPDFTAECLSAEQAGVDLMFNGIDAASEARFVRSCERQGYKPDRAGPHAAENEHTASGFAEVLEGSLYAGRTIPYDAPEFADYRAAVKKYQPQGALGGFGASAWVIGKLFERIAPGISEPPTSQSIVDALYTLQNEKLGGLLPGITFPRDKDRRAVNGCSVPLKLTKGRFVPHDPVNFFACAPGWKPVGT